MARRTARFGARVASLPLVSILGMMWLWHDTGDPDRLAAHAGATFWYVSLPMHDGAPFPWALATGCAVTVLLPTAMTLSASRWRSAP